MGSRSDEFYWVPLFKNEASGFQEIINDAVNKCKSLATAFRSFSSNLEAAQNMLMLPYLLIAPRSKSLNSFFSKLGSECSNWPKKDLVDFVQIQLKEHHNILFEKKTELKYLMYQACILIWSALENLCRDVFILSLNQSPRLYLNLQKNQSLKDRFSILQGTWQKLLEEHNFDLNGKLGYIVGNNKDFSSPKLLQEIYGCLYEGYPSYTNYFQEDSFWVLGQRRHLIVHRCGIVDEEYLSKTNDLNQILGQQLVLTGHDIDRSLGIARQCAIVLYGKAQHVWDTSKPA